MLKQSTDFIVTFYGAYFLKSPMAAQAPSQDLDAFKLAYEMMNNKLYISKYGPLGKLLHASLVRHSWYLTPQLVILSIANRHLGLKERAGLAQKLLGFNCHQPDDFEKDNLSQSLHLLYFFKLLNQVINKFFVKEKESLSECKNLKDCISEFHLFCWSQISVKLNCNHHLYRKDGICFKQLGSFI